MFTILERELYLLKNEQQSIQYTVQDSNRIGNKLPPTHFEIVILTLTEY